MKPEDLFDAVGNADEELIDRCRQKKQNKHGKKSFMLKLGAVAACICVAAGSILTAWRLGIIGGGKSGLGGNSGGSSGGSGITYMSYAGPVFPITMVESTDNIIASRNIDFNFSPYKTFTDSYMDEEGNERKYDRYKTRSIVTDGYTLKNKSSEDVKVRLIYPFAGSFGDSAGIIPKIEADGIEVSAGLNPGPYSGGFKGVIGDNDEEGGTLNLADLDSWEKYKDIINASYMERAFDEWPSMEQKVVVYEISDRTKPDMDGEDYGAATLNMEFNIDYNKTTILTYGMNGGTNNIETGYCSRQTHIPESFNPDYGESAYLIVIGDDIGSYKLQGYKNGGCEKGEELDGVSGTVARYESTLEEVFEKIANIYLKDTEVDSCANDDEVDVLSAIPRDMFIGAAKELMYDYGILSDNGAERYSMGMLEDILSETGAMKRIMYLSFDIDIPAGREVNISAVMEKQASIDFVGDNKDRNGYDMVTRLGSNINFTKQTASISNTDDIEIINQNFGFDLDKGITSVKLEEDVEHYYMDIRKIKKSK